MPPKRKAGGGAKAGGKKAKVEDEAPATVQDAIQKLKAAHTGKKSHKPDSYFPYQHAASVVDDYDCMLNQTNIGHNNNKYYVIQVLQVGAQYFAWNRWGRVGEPGAKAMKGPTDKAAAIKDFEKKFSDKTKNKWANREKFTPAPGKYTLIEMADEDDGDVVDAPVATSSGKKIGKCTLDDPTQQLIKLIFDNDMFKDAMKKFDIDVKKMPLGKLSKAQIAKGFEVLDEIEKELNAGRNKGAKINELSSRFYTVIPHDFGRKVPPAISDAETLREKMDMLLVLGDIELAQSLQKEKDKMVVKGDEAPHPLDVNYGLLKCKLEHVSPKSPEFKIIDTYTKATGGGWRNPTIKHVWKVDRDGEGTRFKVHDKIDNRKLLWHGTNVAVVTAILKSGLRIMPHSGGRVGRGIYFASENSKSAGYVGTAGKAGIMFLNEVALGKEKHINRDDSSLRCAPAGYDSIVARGWNEPDPKLDTSLEFDKKKVIVPQGKPVQQPSFTGSSFSQSEYLVYKESQGARFKVHDKIDNRKLLWHGTNVAVVTAILKSGLRIMPHSGGRVGRGIYFASENSKSAGYVRPAGKQGIMFLNEVALGKEHHIDRSDGSLTKAPGGFDSIVAMGRQEPDPRKDTQLTFEKKVVVPQGSPVQQPKWNSSAFSQSEYLVYKESQGTRFKAHDKLDNRKLLWHGTNIAVVAAILKNGLRIMPHSGGAVGRGIYFASENSKSSGYVRPAGNGMGCMFLNEIALGKEHHINKVDCSLTVAPPGFDSVVARGRQEPDPTKDTTLKFEKKVMVPQGKPVDQSKWKSSQFWQSEYLIYKESQCRIRYILLFNF